MGRCDFRGGCGSYSGVGRAVEMCAAVSWGGMEASKCREVAVGGSAFGMCVEVTKVLWRHGDCYGECGRRCKGYWGGCCKRGAQEKNLVPRPSHPPLVVFLYMG